jgi:hypothetical protein
MMKKNSIFTAVLCFWFWFSLQSFAAIAFCQPWNGRNNELNSCSPCVAGTFSTYGVSCNSCPEWSYAWPASSSCSACPSWYTSKEWSIGESNCQSCPSWQVIVDWECINSQVNNWDNLRNVSWWSNSSSWWTETLSQTTPINSWWPVYNQIPLGWWMWLNSIRKVVIQKFSKVIKKKKLIIKR